uniref:NADH dehydrogenase subunit 4 n=1 Tax=Chrysotila carterae TaxID=13221 RepID=UPI0023AB391C|nr:NADH dehydrogenase subunit 4 [Chrysotila carterae]WCH62791.1 NADH dehydrogenase subunit 4 [Chrysotila carterae]
MLVFFTILPLLGIFPLLFIKKKNCVSIKNFSLLWSLLVLNSNVILLFYFDSSSTQFQLVYEIPWLQIFEYNIALALDSISLLMTLLTTFLFPACILILWNFNKVALTRLYMIIFFVLESILLTAFCSLDLLVFYVLFEATLIPMFLIIGIFGSRERKIRASYLLFLYTLFSSLLMLLSILFLYQKVGTTNYIALTTLQLDSLSEKFCWVSFFIAFAVKLPMFPFHIWLPEAHCEAPTSGSVLLAGILLKLGSFGLIRYNLCIFQDASAFFSPVVFTFSSLGIIYASLFVLQQVDLKKIIAYSSVGHMSLILLGIFSNSFISIVGAITLMLSHGITSSALFMLIGVLYERHNTRIIKYYSGLVQVMPLFSTFFVTFSLANLALPSTSNFIGEVLILVGCFFTNTWSVVFAALGVILSASYSLWLSNRILFGNVKSIACYSFRDLNRVEVALLLPFLLLTFFFGVFPNIIFWLVSFGTNN